MTHSIEVSDKDNRNQQPSVKKAIQSLGSHTGFKGLVILTVSIVALAFGLITLQGSPVNEVQQLAPGNSEQLMSGLPPGSEVAFNYLANQRSNICGLQPEVVLGYSDEMRLQGSCCSPMDLHRYQEQVEGLRQYADIRQIPVDPYDMPVSLVQELLAYQTDIQLTAEQQLIYDEAMTLSDEGGPCCCRCWRWYAFEGMGKYLITERNWNAQELAELWTLTDGCGGEGHQHS
jgi:hypothetical protein